MSDTSDAPDLIASLDSDCRSLTPVGHAVVVGGGMAGLLAARVLVNHFERVTLIERDALTDNAQARKGVPQGRMLHAMLPRRQRIIEGCFLATVTSCRPPVRCRCEYRPMRWR
jgi:NADPH-dependent 2,4-dienoyl-CoA reductase/sulfur reductase-like enzyme